MLINIVEVEYLADYRLFLRFEDGKNGEVDISKLIPFNGIFTKLKDKSYFADVQINDDLGTIYWENGADIAPETLYDALSKR